MGTSAEIKQRASALAEKTDVNSITPKEVGGIMYDLASHGENVLRNGGTLGIRKVYESVAAMEADSTNPKDFWGDPIKKGNLVVIYDGTTTGVDNNKIYAFMKPGWELATKLDAAYATKAETDAKLAELGSNQGNIRLIGEGSELSKLYLNLISGHIYRIYFINPDWSNTSSSETQAKLYFTHRTLSNQLVYDISVGYGESVDSYYTITAEESLNNNRYSMSLRADEGQEVYIKIIDITDNVLYQDGITLEGNGETLVRTRIPLQANRAYKLYITKDWKYSGSNTKFYVSHRTTNNALIVDYNLTNVSYEYTIFSEETINGFYTMSIRADKGEIVNMRIEDVTNIDDYKKINMVAGYFGSTGYIKGALHTEANAKDFFRSYYNVNYYKTNGRCQFYDVQGLEQDQKLYIYSYDSNFIFKKKDEYTKDVIVDAEYVRFAVISEDTKKYSELNIKIGLIASEFTEVKEGYRGDNIAGETIRYFSFEINTPQSDNIKGSSFVGNKTDRNFTNGYILLPKNYEREGKPCKLAINCHGTSGYPFELNNLDDERVEWLAAAGYAVVDCSPYGWLNYKRNPGNFDGNMPNALAISCYASLYKWVTENYNVEKEVYVYGKSAGGLLATTFGSLNTFPIKAIASISGSVSSVVNMMCVANTRNNNFLKEVGCENPNVSSWLGSAIKGEPCSVSDRNYVIENYELIKDYDPLLYHLIGVDKVKMLSRMMEIGFNHFAEDSELNDIISNGYKAYHYPIKIWHAIDDENVPFATSKWYQQLISNAGGMCFLREFPENTGKHYIDAPSHEEEGVVPTVEYTTLLGESVTMSVVYAEMIDWFNRW